MATPLVARKQGALKFPWRVDLQTDSLAIPVADDWNTIHLGPVRAESGLFGHCYAGRRGAYHLRGFEKRRYFARLGTSACRRLEVLANLVSHPDDSALLRGINADCELQKY